MTVDRDDRVVDAVAVKGDRILATGSAAALQSYVGPGTRIIDLEGRAVIPESSTRTRTWSAKR
jgi:predicted amidohydrolase YtcJ